MLITNNLIEFNGAVIVLILLDLVLNRLFTLGRILTLNHFLYLQINKKTLFACFVLDAFLSLPKILFFLFLSFYIFLEEFYLVSYIKLIFVLFFVNTLIERSLRLIKKQTLFYIISGVVSYVILIYYFHMIPFEMFIVISLFIVLLLFLSFNKFCLIQ
ncbi:hypothetical protein A8C32_14565 [Flavivirga aquatica]|uniref:Uncharacterized protein n=1 Tax=Flavivirga aquatica TaxID=1849968 RepID=A0A1E5TCI1_9FLAO|nr:hypothetical protein A8C32_14565 [Flavivirga aquatica]